MFQQILVGCDRGPGTIDALRLATELAGLRDDTELVLVHAYVPNAARFGRRGKAEELDDALHGEGMQLLEELRDGLPGELHGRIELLSLPVSSPAYALHDLASGRGADLIVIGPAQRGPVGRLFLGSDSTGILHGAPCPVAIPARTEGHAHSADATREIAAIGVGYDGSGVADRAVDLAAHLAVALDRPLDVIGVADFVSATPPTDGFGGPAPIQPPPVDPDIVDAEVEALLQERIANLPGGARGRAVTLHGDAADRLADRSAELHLLVVGSRDHGPVQHILLGSTSRRVLDEARCPVIVVPRPDAD
ncbi:universal stress protein [Patulibacter sp.]|uniref:universal stress protein n=1 Tax=Patulibacter sp. TaxID=1912859 RepID=UPI002726A4AD|nr:universal stress protein [Patulibacter sp.]MDO9407775.1 universal stress protein [Patulibacter sp.]